MLLWKVAAKTVLAYLDSCGHLEEAYPALKLYCVPAGGRSDDLINYNFGETPVAEAQDMNPVGGADSTLDRANCISLVGGSVWAHPLQVRVL